MTRETAAGEHVDGGMEYLSQRALSNHQRIALTESYCLTKQECNIATESATVAKSVETDHLNSTLSEEDISFLMRTELLRVIPERFQRTALMSLRKMSFGAGQRIICQGSLGDSLFLIQRGKCLVILEKNHEFHVIGNMKPGDIFGELALLTGDFRSAHVETLTDVVVWSLDKVRFEHIANNSQELVEFLTDLATERLCSQKITAEKNVGRYRVTDVIAEGGWSIVYKGFHSVLNLPVAIKMLKHSMALDSDFYESFQREAKTIALLNHDNIVRVYDIEQSYKTVFIIMEFLRGITLRQVIDSGVGLPLPRILKILLQICYGLDYAHAQGVVHQDVKPGNVFIVEGDKAKIVDFGLATPIGGCSDDLPGTPHYMAPEQIEGEPVDPRTDIYSLGITAYEMATGVRPYPDDICQTLEYHMTKNTPDPRKINPDLPERFVNFVKRSTRKEPAERFQSVAEAINELELIEQEYSERTILQTNLHRKNKSLAFSYDSSNEQRVDRILKEFCDRLRRNGVNVKVSSFKQ